MKRNKIVVVGLGYVGLSNCMLLSQNNEVTAIDIDANKVNKINNGEPTVEDEDIKNFLKKKSLNIKATLPSEGLYKNSDYAIIATPTNFDEITQGFNTLSVEKTIQNAIAENPNITLIIRSTIPIGFTDQMNNKFQTKNIFFVPEFLREGKALYDNLHPARLLIGGSRDKFELIKLLFTKGAEKKDIDVLLMSPSEAESSKLFSNTYLAMRVAFFNELDSFAMAKRLNTKNIINALSLDPRIGSYYNNPSFGYGGYCLPKDTKQLLADYKNIPQKLIDAIVYSNEARKKFIVGEIIKLKPKVVGIYRLIMKEGSDNFRESSVQDIIKLASLKGLKVIIYEPIINDDSFCGTEVVNNFEKFSKEAEIILANRLNNELSSLKKKVFTRDIFNSD